MTCAMFDLLKEWAVMADPAAQKRRRPDVNASGLQESEVAV
jgi:hypothetical protein